jgi:adenylosuccinate synthase
MGLDELLKDVQILAVVCNQFGDSGKGKFSDYFASHWADVCARGTGGNNAGHTVVLNGVERIFHLIPAGIVNDANGMITVLGKGMVIDLGVLCSELDELSSQGLSYDNLMISKDAFVIMPYQIERDKAMNQSQKNGGIGSTGRGIGPCYEDKIGRRGIKIGELFDEAVLEARIKKAARFYPEQKIDVREVMQRLKDFSERIRPHVKDTDSLMFKFASSGKRISLEGAQGLLLSINHGTPPYLTGSDCSLDGTASGVGIPARAVDKCFGIVRFPSMNRVGGGPFVTELGGRKSEEYCGKNRHTKLDELKKYGIPHRVDKNGKVKYDFHHKRIFEMVNSKDPFIQGIGIRLATGNYGATTGRPRRIGWTDAVALKYAVRYNGALMIFTNPDSIAGANEFKICYGYRNGSQVSDEFSTDAETLRNSHPLYESYPGYGDIRHVRRFNRLPKSLLQATSDVERFTGGHVVAFSIGPEREETIIR